MPGSCGSPPKLNQIYLPAAPPWRKSQGLRLHEWQARPTVYTHQTWPHRGEWPLEGDCHMRVVSLLSTGSPFLGRMGFHPEKGCGDRGSPGGTILVFAEFSIAYFHLYCYFIISTIAPPALTDDFIGCRKGWVGLYFTEHLQSLCKNSLWKRDNGI